MKTLQEKYKGTVDGTFSKSQFLAEARQQMPALVTQYNSYQDAVNILTQRGVLAIVVESAEEVEKHYTEEELYRGVEHELADKENSDKAEVIQAAEKTAKKNLKVHRNYYHYKKANQKLPKEPQTAFKPFKKSEKVDKVNGMKKLQNLKEALATEMKKRLEEGRRAKLKGGKVVTENDYDTGGYVELMGPDFDKAITLLQKSWDDWQSGALTEPGMVEFAKKDALNYIEKEVYSVDVLDEEINESVEKYFIEVAPRDARTALDILQDSFRGQCEVESTNYYTCTDLDTATNIKATLEDLDVEIIDTNVAETSNLQESVESNVNVTLLKEAITKAIKQSLVKEAASEKLESYINYENVTNEDLAKRVRENATKLAKHVTDVEETYLKLRENVENCCTACGDYLGPELLDAFKNDLSPILSKFSTISYKPQNTEPDQNNPQHL